MKIVQILFLTSALVAGQDAVPERTTLLVQALEVASLYRDIKAFEPTLKRLNDDLAATAYYLEQAKKSKEQADKSLSEKIAKLKADVEILEKKKACKLDEKFECMPDKK